MSFFDNLKGKSSSRDYLENDVNFIISGLTDVNNSDRLSFVSSSQIKARVCAICTKEVYDHPEIYRYLTDIQMLGTELMFYFSTSFQGIGLDKVIDGVHSRLAVTDSKKIKSGVENELE